VYFGHIHGFGVQDFSGVRYVLTGGGGSPLFPSGARDRFHHYLVVSVGPDGVSEAEPVSLPLPASLPQVLLRGEAPAGGGILFGLDHQAAKTRGQGGEETRGIGHAH
ncbi:hypothetical protein ACFL2T_07585, partial [Elusimicrobiota bacterium]